MSGSARRLPIAVVLIAWNEERDLPGAIESVPFAAEVVVVDSGSTDRTREAAAAFDRPDRPVRVIERAWDGHVAQKGFALRQAREEWVLCLDADERVSPELAREIESLFDGGSPRAAGYTVPRRTRYLGRWMRGGWYPDRKLRLVRRDLAEWRGVDPHDRLEVRGRVEPLRGDLLHLSYRDLSDHLRKLDLFTTLSASGKRREGTRHPVLRMLIHPPARFIKLFLLRAGRRDAIPGLIAAGMGALYAFLKYAKLWELEDAEGRQPAASKLEDDPAPPAGSSGEATA